ncbi:GSCOCT00014229001.2-RA-CDS [Cotesia congregata]|uniref:Cc_bv21.1_29.22 n=2 Tax=root TaxID=1 RepID=S6D9K0_COTCN|nr:GSCOCT00014229001.2-RA-CDS [Cotesia congregata]CAG5092438.1 cc_bv21.1_29.22 [Cotesia congregata]CCB96411.1 hypothetical protein BV21-1 [Bracoviriform congregatae]CCQ71191.1 hypothetical protein BV21-1 [Cotesia congregata]
MVIQWLHRKVPVFYLAIDIRCYCKPFTEALIDSMQYSNKSSMKRNRAKKRFWHAIIESGQFQSRSLFYGLAAKSIVPCLVTEKVSGQLRPVFKKAAEAFQKYVAEHTREN